MNLAQVQDDLRGLPQIVPRVDHRFCGGIYSRSIHLEPGVMIEGALHRTHHPYVLSVGRVLVMNGGKSVIIQAPYYGETKPGDKRFIYAYEYSIFTTFHATDLTDIVEIERTILGEEL